LAEDLFITIKITIMNNKVKIALAVLTGSAIVLAFRKAKKNKEELFTAPDGISYRKDQIYRTFEGDLYKNGKKFHFNVPEAQPENNLKTLSEDSGNVINNYDSQIKEVNYHQKGARHQ